MSERGFFKKESPRAICSPRRRGDGAPTPFISNPKEKSHPLDGFFLLELVMGVGPMNLVITNDALYQLSYTSDLAARRYSFRANIDIIANECVDCKPHFSKIPRFLHFIPPWGMAAD